MEALDTECPEAATWMVMTSNGVIALPNAESPAESRHKAAAVQTCVNTTFVCIASAVHSTLATCLE